MLGLFAQIKTFFLTLLLGLTAGMVFHYYQLTIRALRAGKYSLYLLDLFLWTLMILLISVGMLLINQGELRIYFFLFLIAGGLIYYKMLAASLERPLGILAAASEKALRFLAGSFIKPMNWLWQGCKGWWRHWRSGPPPEDISE